MYPNLSDLETKGFVVLKNFFQDHEIQELSSLYIDGRSKTQSKILQRESPRFINEKIDALLKNINQLTNLRTDFVQKILTYYDTSFVSWKWHQDREPYLLFQDSYHTLNIWFPIIKASPNESGLSLVPMDKILAIDEKTVKEKILGKGRQMYRPSSDRKTEMIDDVTGERSLIDVELDSLLESPDMLPGDIIIFRFDVIHRTQSNTRDDRIGASVRCYNSKSIVGIQSVEMGIQIMDREFPNNQKNDHRRLYLMRDLFYQKNSQLLPLAEFEKILNEKNPALGL